MRIQGGQSSAGLGDAVEVLTLVCLVVRKSKPEPALWAHLYSQGSGGRGKEIFVSLRPAWPTECGDGPCPLLLFL